MRAKYGVTSAHCSGIRQQPRMSQSVDDPVRNASVEFAAYKRLKIADLVATEPDAGKKAALVTFDGFWSKYASKYPRVHRVALKYCYLPATSTATERVFSASTRLDTKLRSRLTPDIFDAMIFLHHTYKDRLLADPARRQQYNAKVAARRRWVRPDTGLDDAMRKRKRQSDDDDKEASQKKNKRESEDEGLLTCYIEMGCE